jgi:GrpB-like predicted nucleotidyltransferase (UPF0157 family)
VIELDDRYFERFSDTAVVELVPYDPALEVLAQRYIARLRDTVGPVPEIEHRGATALHMVGKGEIDLYVRVNESEFAEAFAALETVLGPPGSLQPHRARFNDEFDGIEVEVMLVEKDHPEERAGRRFFHYLQTHPEAVAAYAEVKRRYAPVSRREYYRQKHRFVCSILERAREEGRLGSPSRP